MWVALFSACTAESDPKAGDTAPEAEPPLAAPRVAVAGATYDGAFKSTCSVALDLAEPTGGAVSTTLLDPFDGGLWDTLQIQVAQQLVATITWSDCENTSAGTGSYTSSTFSGEDGDFFVVHYNGIDAGFEWMVQREEFAGGRAHAQLAEGAVDEDLAGLATELGARVSVDPAEPSFRTLAWDGAEPVADVLDALTALPAVTWAEPEWLDKPAWW